MRAQFNWALLAAVSAVQAVASPAQSARVLAHPIVHGSAGPYKQVTLTLVRRGDQVGAPFTGSLDTGTGRKFTLAGPDEPADFFIVDPKAVLFTPLDRTSVNGIVILYDSSQIGPGNGTDHLALVYRVKKYAVTRLPNIEVRLAGAKDAVAVRTRLKALRR